MSLNQPQLFRFGLNSNGRMFARQLRTSRPVGKDQRGTSRCATSSRSLDKDLVERGEDTPVTSEGSIPAQTETSQGSAATTKVFKSKKSKLKSKKSKSKKAKEVDRSTTSTSLVVGTRRIWRSRAEREPRKTCGSTCRMRTGLRSH